jgi:predicted permease
MLLEHWRYTIPLRLRSLFRRQRVDEDLGDEIRDHLERRTADYIAQGLSSEEARYAARREFGGIEQAKEKCRDTRKVNWVYDFAQDAAYALRQSRKNPGFTAVVMLTLALGIGANTAIFSVINAVMLRMLPVQHPERLVQIAVQGRRSAQSFVSESFSYPLFQELRQRNQVFTDIAAFDYWNSFEAHLANPNSGATNESTKAQLVSANFFSLLGINAVIGRTFTPDEDQGAGAHPVAVISYVLWTRLFARDAAALGKTVAIVDTPFTIVGVAPAHFTGVNPGRVSDLWIPISMQPQVAPGPPLINSNIVWLTLIARLKSGVSREQAGAGLDLIYQQTQHQRDLSKASAQARQDFFSHRIVLLPAAHGTDYLRQEFKQPLFLLMGMVGLVLLIACANMANLLLARASVRQPEITVRLALGAGRRRLIRQLLTESVLLALAGSAPGVLFAYWGSPLLVALMSQGQDKVTLNVHPDVRVLVFTVLVAAITGIGFGLAPALRATRITASPGQRHLTASRPARRLGAALVVTQVAMSLVMIIGAGLLLRTFHNLETLDPGFNRHRVLLFGLDPTRVGYKNERAVQLCQRVLGQIRQVPGVRSASFSFLTPISGSGWDSNAGFVEGYTPPPGEDMNIDLNFVGPGYFETLGTPVLFGRDFGLQDHPGSIPVALINLTMARRFFGRRNPIGKHFGLGQLSGQRSCEILGVVGDAKYSSLRENVPPTAYLYIPQLPQNAGGVIFEVRSAVPPASLVPRLRSLIQRTDARLSATDFTTLAEQVDNSLYQERMMSALSTFFGVLALVLAAIGLFGVMSYAVARRTNEIGIRMALGARRGGILRMILREALVLAGIGLVVGLPSAWAATRFIRSMLYGLKATDPVTIVAATLMTAAVAVVAGYVPARRATKVDPMVALRFE